MTEAHDLEVAAAEAQPLRHGHILKTLLRLGLSVVALVVAALVLRPVFEDLDLATVRRAIASLSAGEWAAFLAVFGAVIWANGLLTAAVVPKLPIRRGVTAYLGSSAVSSTFPGPGDLALRLLMYRSWDYSMTIATVSVAASGMVTVGTKLVLPAVAAVPLFVTGRLTGDTGRFAVIGGAIALVAIAVVLLALLRPGVAARAGVGLERVVGAILRRVGRPGPEGLGDRLVEARDQAIGLLAPRWPRALLATVVLTMLRLLLLVLALRFVGVPHDALTVSQIFAAYAIVELLTVVPITAGGAGVVELGYIGLLTGYAGAENVNQVTAGVMLFRLATWIAIIPIGWFTVFLWRLSVKRGTARLTGAREVSEAVAST
ncbi:MAG TPA: lysylphosphatidylglycerol synthase domain-containing protein [Acidimicrobiales bacterium]|nr:lysylphosphatidylglycerol synthase domain-containing protein [Acidimicrobiales bacterium]